VPEAKRGAASRAHSARLRGEKAAFGLIRFFSVMTIAVLGLIMGFILYKGFRYSNETRSQVLPYAEEAPDGLCLVVNRKTAMDSIEFPALLGIFTDEYINWSKINAAGYDLLPLKVEGDAAAARLLFGAGAEAQWGSSVKAVPSDLEALALVESTPGAAALVREGSLSGSEGLSAHSESAGTHSAGAIARPTRERFPDLRVVPVKRLVVAVNEEAMALVDNRSVEDQDDAAIGRLMGGKVANWKELGGPDLPVKLIAPQAGSSLASIVADAGLAASGPPSADDAERSAAIASTSGAAGYMLASDAQAAELQTLTRKGLERGWNLTFSYIVEAPRLSGKVGGISTIVLNTFLMLLLTIAIAAPIGVAAAIYLVEYAKQGPLVRVLRLGTETLAGIPSIIFGLFGFLFFVDILGFGFGLLSGCLTLTLMILPTIVRTSEEALKSVPGSLREGSLALGATKLQTILRVAVPAAAPGIITGLILGVGRAVGETAALVFTMGSDYKLAKGLFSSARALSTHVYLLFAEGISFDRAFSTATVLILIVLAFNFAARRLVGRRGDN
jgi:phosphate transport system permease protein